MGGAMTTVPDRVSIDKDSKFYDARYPKLGVRFDGVEKNNVAEYCVSEGWVLLIAGTARARNGKPLTFTYRGKVEPYWREQP
jgi:hypothetical protein